MPAQFSAQGHKEFPHCLQHTLHPSACSAGQDQCTPMTHRLHKKLLHLLCHTLPLPSLVHSDKALSLCINARSTNFGWNVLGGRKSFCWREVQVPNSGRLPGFFHWPLTLCSALRTSLATRDTGAAGRTDGTDFKQGQGSRRSNANRVT